MKSSYLWIIRIFVAVLFIFSGWIKLNDPLGFGYKLEEYFEVFGLAFLNPLASSIAILLCALEVILGVFLLFGLYIKQTLRALLGLIIFFTLLTFVSAFFKVVTNCGCFGDAIPLTPWQSFIKDLVLLILILVLFKQGKHISPLLTKPKVQGFVALAAVVLSLGFGLYTYNFLPVIDFLPYKVGANIPRLMEIPANAVLDKYEITYLLKHKLSGESKKINDQEYLKSEIWKDKNWEIEGTPEKKLIKKGYEPPIKDLNISDAQGTNYTREILENPYYQLIIVAYDLKTTDRHALGDLNALALNLQEQYHMHSLLLTSSGQAQVEDMVKALGFVPPVFYADAIPLKSMVRANPGVMLMKNGIVIKKWSSLNRPNLNDIAKIYQAK